MKKIIFLLIILNITFCFAQKNEQISSIDFVEVLNNNHAEILFYYQNNWKQLRIKALEKGYITGYQLLETTPTEKTPYSFILITTYANQKQFNSSEDNFGELISNSGGLKLLNTVKPNEFRKVILYNEAKHLN